MSKTIFNHSLAALIRKILFCHWKIKFISSPHCVISSMYTLLSDSEHAYYLSYFSCQNGLVVKLVDLNLAQQVRSVRLVSEDGIIRPETFYKYLMVWCSMDYLGYTFSQVTSVCIYRDIGFHSPFKNFFVSY